MLGLLSIGLPKKAIALALAAVVMAATLAVAPVSTSVPVVRDVPIIGDLIADGPSASAHVQQQCTTYTTYSYPTRHSMQNGGQPVPITRTICISVAHTHPRPWWKRALVGGSGGALCAGVAVPLGPGGMLAAGAICGGLMAGVSG